MRFLSAAMDGKLLLHSVASLGIELIIAHSPEYIFTVRAQKSTPE